MSKNEGFEENPKTIAHNQKVADKKKLLESDTDVLDTIFSFEEVGDGFSCELCNFSTNKLTRLAIHMLRHAGLLAFKCGICGHKKERRDIVRHHIKVKHGKKENKDHNLFVKCDLEVIKLMRKIAPNFEAKYMNKLRVNSDGKFTCNYCDFRSENKGRLSEHLLAHEKVLDKENPVSAILPAPIHACSFCPKKFCSLSGIKKHLRYTHNRNYQLEKMPDLFECESCSKKFATNSALDNHIEIDHK